MTPSRLPLDARIYRGSLNLFPAGFRRDFSDDMLRDFEDDRNQALESRHAVAMWTFRVRMLRDFTRTLGVQWLRTGLPAIGGLAMATTLVFIVGSRSGVETSGDRPALRLAGRGHDRARDADGGGVSLHRRHHSVDHVVGASRPARFAAPHLVACSKRAAHEAIRRADGARPRQF